VEAGRGYTCKSGRDGLARPGPGCARADLNGPRSGTAATAGRAVPARGPEVRPGHGRRPVKRAGPARRAELARGPPLPKLKNTGT
jgi:hypothetical protein